MFDLIESAIADIRKGRLVIVVDDEDRENEGDFICAAQHVTPDVINFMSKHGRGLICAPLLEDRCEELQLSLMVNNNTALHETAKPKNRRSQSRKTDRREPASRI